MSPLSAIRYLQELARLYGIQTAYYDVNHRRRPATVESLLAVLGSLGAPLTGLAEAPTALRQHREQLWKKALEPVVVAWEGQPFRLNIRLPLGEASSTIGYQLKLETGEEQRGEWHVADRETRETVEVEGKHYVSQRISLPGELPRGYHRLILELPGRDEECLAIAAPLKAYRPPDSNRRWGVFLPLYALHTRRSWGGGDFSDLADLVSWTAEMGGGVVATLPLLATFTGEPFDPSPYLPVSRLLWNEFYLDLNAVPELNQCRQARALLESTPFQQEIKTLNKMPLVDYQRQMRLKRRIIEEMSRYLYRGVSGRLEELERFSQTNPLVDDYARFRAAGDRYPGSWRAWHQPLRDGTISQNDYTIEDRRYHLYAQWLAQQQMKSVAAKARQKNVRLYLDLPLGVNPDGYDVWRERESFVTDTAAGAPPDTVYTGGQNWGFPPLHPERIRERGYRYLIDCLRHHLGLAGILRIDHVMGLHRLFVIPNGMEASHGVYLRYHAEELYAILALESQHHQAVIVGEDLGTVPYYVRPTMRRHNFQNMYILHYELAIKHREGLNPVPASSVASLNTHDMPPFAAFWQGSDDEKTGKSGSAVKEAISEEAANSPASVKQTLAGFLKRKGWLRGTANNTFAVLKASLSFLAASRARLVLVNLEDLWLETSPQNVPGTGKENLNWRRRARHAFERFCQMPRVVATLETVNKLRKRKGH